MDTMTLTKIVGATCGSLLVFLMGSWAAETIYHVGAEGGEYGEAEQAYVIDTGAEESAGSDAAPAEDFAAVFAAADVDAGEKVFSKCKACHKVDGTNAQGPHLDGVVNRGIGSVDGFGYSAAITGLAGEVWSPEQLSAFLTNPKGYAPGTKMAFPGLPKIEDRANLIAWLATQS